MSLPTDGLKGVSANQEVWGWRQEVFNPTPHLLHSSWEVWTRRSMQWVAMNPMTRSPRTPSYGRTGNNDSED